MTGAEEKPQTHPPPQAPKWVTNFGFIWPTIVSMIGGGGCIVMLLQPSLRDATAWMVFGGAAGILPVNRLLEAVSVLGGKK